MASSSSSPATSLKIPTGYTMLDAPDGTKYLVPDFMFPASTLTYAIDEMKSILDVEHAGVGVS